MPKGTYRKKRYNRKRRMPLSRTQAKAVKKIAWKEAHKDMEVKFVEQEYNITTINDTPQITQLALPSRGTGNNQYLGEEIVVKSVELTGDIDCGTATSNHARVILFQYLESDNITLNAADILKTPSFPGSMYRMDPDVHYRVISDREYYWDSNTSSAVQPYKIKLKGKDIPKRHMHLDNSSVTGNVGALYLWCSAGGSDDIDLRGLEYRMKFYDA